MPKQDALKRDEGRKSMSFAVVWQRGEQAHKTSSLVWVGHPQNNIGGERNLSALTGASINPLLQDYFAASTPKNFLIELP